MSPIEKFSISNFVSTRASSDRSCDALVALLRLYVSRTAIRRVAS